MKKSRFTDSQILAVLKQAEAGTQVPQLCREHGISSATFYKWRSKFGGMDASLMSQLKDLQDELGLSYLFISHDLSVVEFISDRIGVMLLGELVEEGDKATIYRDPRTDYTRRLLSAIPRLPQAREAQVPRG